MKHKKRTQVYRFKKQPVQKGNPIKYPQFINTLRSKLWFIFLLTLVIVFFGEIIFMAEAIFTSTPIYYWLSSIITGIFFVLLAKFAQSEKLFSVFDWSFSKRELGIGFICGLGILAWIIVADQTISRLFSNYYVGMGGIVSLYQPVLFMVALLGKGILLPFGEEMLFRKYFLGILLTKRSIFVALVLNALFFGVRALDPFNFWINFVSGLILGVIFIKVSLRSAILASITANIGVLIISFFYLH